ncbi:MAG TPA: cellulase family glycosylhydrolase [Candidatus Angelobacter sp.]
MAPFPGSCQFAPGIGTYYAGETQPMPDMFQLGSARSIHKDGPSLRDAQGRFVLLRGFNFGGRSKHPPFLPIMPLGVQTLDAAQFHSELAAVMPQLDLMQQIGVSAVRLLVMWKALEPAPGDPEQLQPDAIQYLQFLKEIMDALFARGIFVFLDFHQDIAHERFGGDGFPDWAMAVDKGGGPRPADLKNSAWGLLYFNFISTDPRWNLLTFAMQEILLRYNSHVRGTLWSFWQNSLNNFPNLSNFPARTHLEKIIGQVANFFKNHPGVLGYEPFNEPMPVGLGNAHFESTVLPQYYANAINEISRFDTTALIFLEPRMTWNLYLPTEEEFGWETFVTTPFTFLNTSALPAQERLVFSFHYYDPNLSNPVHLPDWDMSGQASSWPTLFTVMVNEGTKRNMVPFITEFGGEWSWQARDPAINPGLYQYRALRALIDLSFQQIEARFLHATYWHFDLYNSETDGDNWNQENFSFLGPDRMPRNWDLFARPYPLRSAAAPQLLWFDAQSKNFVLILSGAPVGAASVLHVPQALQYSTGFEIRSTSPAIQWDETRQLLAWAADPQQTVHALVISPPNGLNTGVLPASANNLLSAMPFFTMIQPSISVLADQTIDVPEKSSGVDTGIDIMPGQFFEFQASGSLWAGILLTGENGPAGWNTIDHNNQKLPLHSGLNAYPFSLIGRFGSVGDYFYIGKGMSRTKFTGSSTQRIFLRTNDDSPGNGHGSFSCRVLVSQNVPPAPNSIFVHQDVPAEIHPGKTFPVTIRMRNVSGSVWAPPFRLGSQSPQDNLLWGLGRVDVPAPVAPGQEALFQFTVTAPPKPGKYSFQWRMVQDGVAWFGPATPLTTINVPALKMEAHITTTPVPLNKPITLTVWASDIDTHQAITGAPVFIDGVQVGVTSQPFTHIFRFSTRKTGTMLIGPGPGPQDPQPPQGWVVQPGYENAFIDFGFSAV